MISFRYHVVSVVAVLLALAAGVALGGGPLSEVGRGAGDEAAQRAQDRSAQLSRQLDRTEGTAAFQDDFASGTASAALKNRLTRRPVTLVSLPGADTEVATGLAGFVKQAGGSVVGRYEVRDALVAADGKSLVDTLGTQLLESVEDTGVPAEATTYDRMGQLIGRAVATSDDGGANVDGAARDILSSLRGAKLLTGSSDAERRGSLVIMLLGTELAEVDGVQNIVGGLASGMATQSDGLVVAGSTASASDGVLGLLRDEVSFTAGASSVDSVQTVTGQVATVLALAAEQAGEPGHYGAEGIDGALPRG
ncbi:copper transporter [Nocardioides donggukensis]|uniref:Copper transporter n=1 Tax=Nocardioides donggukensis TaxID=2774019 RepID=A0A927K2G9_9ACTN|nr:copper transporter [Nocardioides donggukensis]MBD8869277.1 copper transporter [Nocardioides donggukensis]